MAATPGSIAPGAKSGLASAPASWASSVGVRRSMLANRRVDTGPERALRSHLHGGGLRFRKDFRIKLNDVSVSADVVFPAAKLAVFVDGCFWHQCPEHATMPKRNSDFWAPKLRRNVERDQLVNRALTDAGWTVIRCWEHENPVDVLPRVVSALEAAR
jgi:DNA mismatch endonuclease, patch repair protein